MSREPPIPMRPDIIGDWPDWADPTDEVEDEDE